MFHCIKSTPILFWNASFQSNNVGKGSGILTYNEKGAWAKKLGTSDVDYSLLFSLCRSATVMCKSQSAHRSRNGFKSFIHNSNVKYPFSSNLKYVKGKYEIK